MSLVDRAGSALAICIATHEYQGVAGGGIGTAFAGLAEALARAGRRVTVLCTGAVSPRSGWQEVQEGLRARGIEFVMLPDGVAPEGCEYWAGVSYRTFAWLSERNFDVVHFAEWTGLGYWSMAAKRQGVAFGGTRLAVGLHGSSRWVRAMAGSVLQSQEEAMIDHLERCSIEWADAVVGPSLYIVNWVREAGWQLPRDTVVVPNLLPQGSAASRSDGASVQELVFFGRLESRKGVVLFCDALDLMVGAGEGRSPVAVTFLGPSAAVGHEDGAAYVRKRAKNWPFQVTLIPDLTSAEALSYLASQGRLAVIPSLGENLPCTVAECVAQGLPFIATAVGGTAELLAQEDAGRVLVEPRATALAYALQAAIADGVAPARPRLTAENIAVAWQAWHAERAGWTNPPAAEPASVSRDASADAEYVLVARPWESVDNDALARFARVAGATRAAVIGGLCSMADEMEGTRAGRLMPVASLPMAVTCDVIGPGPLLVRRDCLATMPDLERRGARHEWLVGLLSEGKRIEAVPLRFSRRDPASGTDCPLSALERLEAFRRAVPAVVGDFAVHVAALDEQALRHAETMSLSNAAVTDTKNALARAVRERDAALAEMEAAAREGHAQATFWRNRLAGLLASRAWSVTARARAGVDGVDVKAFAGLPAERAVDAVLSSVWWDLAAPVRLVTRVLCRLRGRKGRPVETGQHACPGHHERKSC